MRSHLGSVSAFVIVMLFTASPSVSAQRMPRENVVDVPAIGEGLCVSNLFQSGMVIQRDKPIHIWGWARPGEKITVTFGESKTTSVADETRRWQVTLPKMAANENSQALIIDGEQDSITLDNLLVGDVWVLGGQSNMEFEIAKVENGNLEIVSANYPQIRILTVPYGVGPEYRSGFARLHEWSDWFGRHFRKGDWQTCTPETVRELSAIGFVFARRVHQASQVPIGVIDASRGGTTVETWTPMKVLEAMESETTRNKLAAFRQKAAEWNAQADLDQRIKQHAQWLANQKAAGKAVPADRIAPPSDLRPGPIGDHNFPGHCYAGMIAPLEGLSVKGILFHQGYNNTFEGSLGVEMYRDVFPEMISAWRTAFQDETLPFGIISLCTDGYPQTRDDYCEKMFNAGIDIRAAQYQSFLDRLDAGDTKIGFASTYDLRRRWYHPQVKIPAGERIARWALATEYGFKQQLPWMPPRLVEMSRGEGRLLLTLDTDVGDPQDGTIQGFAIAGEDGRFHPADVAYAENGKDDRGRVRYDRKRLVLTSPMVPEPVHFRYAWGRNPLANLQAMGNRDLPFATQRSDDWIMEDVPKGILEDAASRRPLTRGDRGKIITALRAMDRERKRVEAERTLNELQ
ncbi:MAG: hypothetical protein AAFV88_18965 [Planctomycetota bacterium]